MRVSFIILSLALLASCGKKVNDLGSNQAMSAFEQKSFVVIPHEENNSVIRNKLLNMVVEESFPSKILNPENEIKNNDELQGFSMSEKDLVNYKNKNMSLAKIIVSYVDREEVYFLPERVLLSNLIKELEVTAGTDRAFKLINSGVDKTYTGGSFYLVSLNHEDLMKNDQKFFESSVTSLKSVNQQIVIDSFKETVLIVNYDFYIQKLGAQSFGGKRIKCTRDLIEAGMCGTTCGYKMNMPSSVFEKAVVPQEDDLGLSVRFLNQVEKVGAKNLFAKKEGELTFKIHSQEAIGDSYTVEVIQNASQSYPQRVTGYDYNSVDCAPADRNKFQDVALQSKVNLTVGFKTLGRGVELKSIKL